MGRIVIACYRPKLGKESELEKLCKIHVKRLLKEVLVTDRKPILMKSFDGTIIEVFEWKSKDAIEEAHTNIEVQKMWSEYAEVCDYEIPNNIKEFSDMFSEFTPLN